MVLQALSGKKASTAYFPLSGTSMATGVVSGSVADLLLAAVHEGVPRVMATVVQGRVAHLAPEAWGGLVNAA